MIFHTGYNPDITPVPAPGARTRAALRRADRPRRRLHAIYTKLKETVGNDANYFFDVDPISIWQTNPKALKPELPPMIKMVGDAYMKAKPDTIIKSAHVGMAASNTYLFLTDVLPRAIKKYGGINADELRQGGAATPICRTAARCWASASSSRPRTTAMAGQNDRAFPVIDPVRRRQELRGLAEGAAAARAGAEAAGQLALRRAVMSAAHSVLEVAGLIKRFGGFTAVNNVSFKVDQGEILGLIGPNGSGKSTIFNMLSGTFAPTAGSIRFQGREIAGMPPHRIINRGIGRTFQIPRPFRRLSIFENVVLAGFYGSDGTTRAARVRRRRSGR